VRNSGLLVELISFKGRNEMNLTNRRVFLGSAVATLTAMRYAVATGEVQGPAANESDPTNARHPLVVPGYFGTRPGIQLGTQMGHTASEDEMRFARQLGVEWV
jgi:hypothetical protein